MTLVMKYTIVLNKNPNFTQYNISSTDNTSRIHSKTITIIKSLGNYYKYPFQNIQTPIYDRPLDNPIRQFKNTRNIQTVNLANSSISDSTSSNTAPHTITNNHNIITSCTT